MRDRHPCPLSYLVHQVLDNFIKIKLRPGVAWICVGHLSKGKDCPSDPEENLTDIFASQQASLLVEVSLNHQIVRFKEIFLWDSVVAGSCQK